MGRYNNQNNSNRGSKRCHNNCNRVSPEEVETVVEPAKTIVNTTTSRRVVRHVRPTNIINVNREIVRNEYFYPTTERNVNETVVENYDCGNDLNNPNCRRRR
ncbi:CotD family spore coat protein [Niallia sp. NCCP-28]|uniref:CotD family spore coat protein n=1 Tax=Niallia sp. NCCP-28 TaxID=2934712 RepID=UPI002086C5ED|nr:CotD family spore coat protein [Niallia sp. NCCP-28]GKU82628.1 hypothetical protein NCCP28_20240 [Niallia sp. NCCP-28]